MAREAMDVCLRVLKESNKRRFDSYKVRNSVLIISHITFRDCRVNIFSDNLSRNSCIPQRPGEAMRGGCIHLRIHNLLPLHPVKLVPLRSR